MVSLTMSNMRVLFSHKKTWECWYPAETPTRCSQGSCRHQHSEVQLLWCVAQNQPCWELFARSQECRNGNVDEAAIEALQKRFISNSHIAEKLSITNVTDCCRVYLAQLIRFLVMELTHSGLNPKFDMCVVFMTNYSFSERRCSCR
jgi:hypothetical protein